MIQIGAGEPGITGWKGIRRGSGGTRSTQTNTITIRTATETRRAAGSTATTTPRITTPGLLGLGDVLGIPLRDPEVGTRSGTNAAIQNLPRSPRHHGHTHGTGTNIEASIGDREMIATMEAEDDGLNRRSTRAVNPHDGNAIGRRIRPGPRARVGTGMRI